MRSFLYLLLSALVFQSSQAFSQAGDTLVIQTFSFEEQNNPETAYDSPGRRWFQFPGNDGTTYQKILVYYTLKCFEDGTAGNLGFPCGEWDYLTYNYLWDHTGLLDSNLLSHPQFLLNNQGFEAADLISTPIFDTWQTSYPIYNIDQVISEDEITAMADASSTELFNTEVEQSRLQFLYTAEELVAEGIDDQNPWNLRQIALDLESVQAGSFLKIKVATTDLTELTDLTEANWESSFTGIYSGSSGWTYFFLDNEILLDGTQGLLIDLSLENQAPFNNTLCQSQLIGSRAVQAVAGSDRYLKLSWFDEVKVPQEAFAGLDQQVTISFRIKGDQALQPANSTIFEGVDAGNNRVLNSHLPWGNGRVYWDAGWDGGYDRIDKQANEADYEGVWNHWAFTKNTATGEMKIYLNGVLWHSGSNMDNDLAGIVKFSIGAATGWTNYYDGAIDEFRIWGLELPAEEILAWKDKSLDNTHPHWDQLLVYYTFDGENDPYVADMSGNGFDGACHGSPNRLAYSADELFHNAQPIDQRPALRLISGEYLTTATTGIYEVQVQQDPQVLSTWEVAEHEVVQVDADLVWSPGFENTYLDGVLVNSIEVTDADISVENTTLEYYGYPFEVVDRYEIGRFITPYGINLTLGDDGWTWIYDVTDFAPLLLKDSVELSAGNWQELLDMKFLFIEGTPPRDVKRVERLWGGDFALSTFDQTVPERTVEVQEGEEMFRLKTVASGHQFSNPTNCAEFCYKIHSVDVNGTTQYSWQIMQECADNPLYPQGGTWIFDRAGWCPGAPVTTQDLELTPFVSGDSFTVDYDSQFDTYGNYVFEGYLITYGTPNHALDVEITEILAPSKWKIRSRMNPMCDNPIIRIRNNGSETLTSCTFTYSVDGVEQSYQWTGELGFMESEDVELTFNDPMIYQGDANEELLFEVSLGSPNGGSDENPSNNTSSSVFQRPVQYSYSDLNDNRLIIWVRTNNFPQETSYTLYNANGDVVFERDDFSTMNENYRDTIQLNPGCYLFHLKDSGDDGLSFFANNDGSGYARLKKVSSGNFISFESDFGKEILHYFQWDTNVLSTEDQVAKKPSLKLYPNPSGANYFIELAEAFGPVSFEVFNMTGALIESSSELNRNPGMVIEGDCSDWPSGVYTIRVNNGKEWLSSRLVVQH